MSIGPCQRCAAKSRKSHCNGQLLAKVIAVLLAPAFSIYLGCYYHLSRRGIQEAKKYGSPGFLYIPWDDLIGIQDDKILDQSLSKHSIRVQIFAPLNFIDRKLFQTMGPVRGIMFGLSKPKDQPAENDSDRTNSP